MSTPVIIDGDRVILAVVVVVVGVVVVVVEVGLFLPLSKGVKTPLLINSSTSLCDEKATSGERTC